MKTKIIALMAAGLLTMSLVTPAFAGATKVVMCHQDNNGGHTIEVALSAVDSHLAHGDFEGPCESL